MSTPAATKDRARPTLAVSDRSIAGVSIAFASVCLIAFIIIIKAYPPDTKHDQLSAVGQILGSLFSVWALIGLIASQIMQANSLRIQQIALEAQGASLSEQIVATKASNSAVAIEILSSSLRQIELSCNRIARSLVLSLPDLEERDILENVYKGDPADAGVEFCAYLNNNEDVLNLVINELDTGLSRGLAISYIDLLETAEVSSKSLSKDLNVIDPFYSYFSNSDALQIKKHLQAGLK